MSDNHSVSTDKPSFFSRPAAVFFGSMACCLLWGSAFPAIKVGYRFFEIASEDSASQILFAGLRFSLSGLLVLIFASLSRRKAVVPTRASAGPILVLALFQTILQYLFFYIGLAHAAGTRSSIINGSSAFLAILISALIFRQETLTGRKIAGCVLGLAGVVLVNLGGGGFGFDMTLTGEGFILFATTAYAMSTVLIRRFSQKNDPVLLSGAQFFIGGLVLALLGLAFGGRITHFTAGGIALFAYLVLLSSAAYTLWSVLLKNNPVSRISVYSFMIPVFGVILSALFLRESSAFNLRTLAALALVSAGIYIVNRAPARS